MTHHFLTRTLYTGLLFTVSAILIGCGGSKGNSERPPTQSEIPHDDFSRAVVAPQPGATPAQFTYIAVYDPHVFQKTGLEPAVAIQAANEEANRIHLYSGTNIQYAVVGIIPAPDGVIPSAKMDTVLYKTQTVPGSFTREAMDQYGADFAMVINSGDNSYVAGLTWVGPDTSRDYRNLVIDGNFLGGVVVAHELGHLLGLQHNSEEAPDTYAVGYASEEGKFHTVMHYGRSDYVLEWVFSSPNLLCGKTENVYPCGIPIGLPGQADAVSAIIQNKAQYGK